MKSSNLVNSDLFINFLKKEPDFANYLISRYYNFSKADLFSIIGLNRKGLARNNVIDWDLDLFTKMFIDLEEEPKQEISKNSKITANANILKSYSSMFDWWIVTYSSINSISDTQFIYLEEFYDKKLFAEYFNFKLYPNIYIRYEEKLLKELSSSFSSNTNLQWTNDFIYENIENLDLYNLCSNSAVKIDEDLIEKLGNQIQWDRISLNENTFWNYYFIEKYKDQLNWKNISQNKAIPWSLDFIEHYEHLIDFNLLSQNPSVKWNETLITRFFEKIDWQYLSYNRGINFDYTLIKKFESNLFWGATIENFSGKKQGLSENTGVIWNNRLLEEYYNQIVFNVDGINVIGVIENTTFPWSIDILLDKYEELFVKNKYCWIKLGSNIGVWNVFKPYINDENIKKLILELTFKTILNDSIEIIKEKERQKLETSRYVNFVISLSESEKELFYSAYDGDIDAYLASQE